MSGLVEWAIFLGLSTVAVMTAAGMLVTMSMYRAGLALMSSFVALAGLFILLDADLLAVIQIMMNVGGMLAMVLFMVMLMIDPGGEMMWDMKRQMHLPGPGAFSMSMPRGAPPESATAGTDGRAPTAPAGDWTCPMHPEVSAPGPGDCPKCGMPLVPRAELARGASSDAAARTYTCPMHPEVRQPGPGQCPICGMDLVPEEEGAASPAGPAAAAAPVYTCPMHPEVRRDGPGQCPKCGMDLVPTSETAAPTPQQHVGHGADGQAAMPPAGVGNGMGGMSPHQHYEMMVGMAMSTEQLPWALAIGAASAVAMIALMVWTPWPLAPAGPVADATVAVGELLLSRYMIGFEGAAFLILAGIVGAVIFGKRERQPVRHAAVPAVTTAQTYTCPMHPEVREVGPGQCPICSMDLAPAGEEAAQQAERHEHYPGGVVSYTCPMHSEVAQTGPGQCPKCGMDLVPTEGARPAREHVAEVAIYTCPMHHEIRQAGPGQCPICGMDLMPAGEAPAPGPPGEHQHGGQA